MAFDPENPVANGNGTLLDAVTKDQLNTGLNGQIRYRVSERNLYAYLFGVKHPLTHVMGYFVSVLRERIANFEAPQTIGHPDGDDAAVTRVMLGTPSLGSQPMDASIVTGVSINDLRKNLRDLNEHMERECLSSAARYGITLDASLITGIDPPHEVESALAAINTAHNHVSSDVSLAQASADQKIVQSKRAVEIETLNAHAEVEPLAALAQQLSELKKNGPDALPAYLRNVRLKLYSRAQTAVIETRTVLLVLLVPQVEAEVSHERVWNCISRHIYRPVHCGADILRPDPRSGPVHHRGGAALPRLRAVRQGHRDPG
jgi:regulator of protease activity HflC (stomatin/prohibitin superfamily)